MPPFQVKLTRTAFLLKVEKAQISLPPDTEKGPKNGKKIVKIKGEPAKVLSHEISGKKVQT